MKTRKKSNPNLLLLCLAGWLVGVFMPGIAGAAAASGTTNLELAKSISSTSKITQGIYTFSVLEMEQGSDLNGDGDLFDKVTHIHNIARLTTWSTEHAQIGTGNLDISKVGDGFVSFYVSESRDGATDLNGDGDAVDQVYTAELFCKNIPYKSIG